jgi:hypothetical protein
VKNKLLILLTVALGACSVTRSAPDPGALPWTFNAPPANGYSVTLVSVDPRPGTPLLAGALLNFKVTVSYTMSVSKTGNILLVFQDENNAGIGRDRPQVHFEVTESAGVASLANTVTVPAGARELRVFVPIMPEGLKSTTGEVTIRYPIVKAR